MAKNVTVKVRAVGKKQYEKAKKMIIGSGIGDGVKIERIVGK